MLSWLGVVLQSERSLVNSWSGHMPRLQVWSPVGACTRGNWSMFVSLSPSLPLSLKVNLKKTFKNISTLSKTDENREWNKSVTRFTKITEIIKEPFPFPHSFCRLLSLSLSRSLPPSPPSALWLVGKQVLGIRGHFVRVYSLSLITLYWKR